MDRVVALHRCISINLYSSIFKTFGVDSRSKELEIPSYPANAIVVIACELNTTTMLGRWPAAEVGGYSSTWLAAADAIADHQECFDAGSRFAVPSTSLRYSRFGVTT